MHEILLDPNGEYDVLLKQTAAPIIQETTNAVIDNIDPKNMDFAKSVFQNTKALVQSPSNDDASENFHALMRKIRPTMPKLAAAGLVFLGAVTIVASIAATVASCGVFGTAGVAGIFAGLKLIGPHRCWYWNWGYSYRGFYDSIWSRYIEFS